MIDPKAFQRALLPADQGSLPSPAKIYSKAINLLGRKFEASRAVLFTTQKGRAGAKATYEYCVEGAKSIIGSTFPWTNALFTRELLQAQQPHSYRYIGPDNSLAGFDIMTEWGARSLLCMPLRLNDSVIGIVCLQQCDRERVWSAEESLAFGAAIEELSNAVAIVRPYIELRKQFDRYLIVNELSRQLTLVTNVSDLFHTLVTQLRKILDFNFAMLNLIDETTGRLHLIEQARYNTGRFGFGQFLPPGYSIPGWCIANRRPLIIRNLAGEASLRVRREWLEAGLSGCAAFPLVFNDELAGALLFFTRSKTNFDESELQILHQAVEQVSAAVHRIRTIDQLMKNAGADVQAARREELIKRISKAIGSHLDYDLVLQHAVNELGRYLAVSRCYIVLANSEDETDSVIFEYRASDTSPLTGLPYPVRANLAMAQASRSGEPVMFVEAQSDDALKPLEGFLQKNEVRSLLCHLIAAHSERQAFICLEQCDRTRTWTEDERSLVVTISQELAIALEQAELVARLKAQADREALLNRITAAIRGSLDPQQILQTTVEELGEKLGVERCFIGLVDFKDEQVVIRNEYCAAGIEPLSGRAFDQKLFSESYDWSESGQIIAVDDVMADEQMREATIMPSNVRSIVYVPVHADKRLIAVIGLGQTRTTRRWKNEEMTFMHAVADQVAVAISQARLLEQSKAQAEREALLNQIFKSLADTLDQGEIMEKVAMQLGQSLAVDRCTVSLFDPETERWLGIQSEYLAPDITSIKHDKQLLRPTVSQWLSENQRPLVVDEAENYPFKDGNDKLEKYNIQSLLLVPVTRSGRLTGTIALHQCKYTRRWQEAEIDLMRSVAAQVAVAIDNAYLFQRVMESQQHWQRTFDSMTDGVALLSPESKVICANHALLQLYGGRHWEEIVGRESVELFPVAPGGGPGFDPVKEAHNTRASVQVEITDLHNRILRQNIDPILDENGAISGLILVIRDVTKERRAEQETAQRNRELSALNAISEEITKSLEIDKIIISAFGKAVEVMTADTGLIMLLDEAQETLRPVAYHGQLPEIVVGMLTNMRYRPGIQRGADFKETYVIEDLADESQAPDAVFVEISQRLGLRSALITSLQSKNRTLGLLMVAYQRERQFSSHETQLVTAIGRQVGVAIENARLITSLQDALQELREANRLKDEFLATLSHELRTPLTSIRGWAEILAEREDNDEEMMMGLKAVLNNAESLQQLINDLLELSRIENRVLKLDLEPTDVNLVVMSAVQTVKQMADNRDVRIDQLLAKDLPLINADGNRLQQVFWNLLSNSIKFSRRGGFVRIATESRDGMIEVRVEDDGIGIDPTFLPLVFERFRQADSSSTRRYGGLGIGLSLVKSLVEVHGGEVKAESAGKDQGSTFIVNLPVPQRAPLKVKLPGDEAEKQLRQPAGGSGELKQQALIIEDLEDNLRVLSSIIERMGYEVLTARNTEAGLRMAERYVPKLILIDINMPGRSPFEILASLKGRPDLAVTPVLAVSGFSFDSERQQVLSAGFAGLITKPFRRSELTALVRNLVSTPEGV